MRANSSLPGIVVVAMATLAGCKPAEESSVILVPRGGPSAPYPAFEPLPPIDQQAKLEELLRAVEQNRSTQSSAQTQEMINEIRDRFPPGTPTDNGAPPDFGPPLVAKLYFQCADDVTFAARTAGGRLELFPPGVPNNFVVLWPQPSEPGTHYYTAERAEFRFDGELATLVLGNDRWADCVSNPAAAVWQPPPRGGGR